MHLLYSYPSQADNDHETSNGYVWAVNSRYTPSATGLLAIATQYELYGTVVQTWKTREEQRATLLACGIDGSCQRCHF